MCKSFVTCGSTSPTRRARTARAVSSGVRSTPRHCASTRRRDDIFPDPSGGMYLGGGFKREKHRRNHRGKQADRLRTGNANSGSILFFFVLVLDSSKCFFENEG